MLAQQRDIEEIAGAVERDQQIDRCSLETGDRCQVDRFEGVADRAIVGAKFTGDRPRRQIVELFADLQWWWEMGRDVLAREVPGGGRHGRECQPADDAYGQQLVHHASISPARTAISASSAEFAALSLRLML